jgi:hypothetical protein
MEMILILGATAALAFAIRDLAGPRAPYAPGTTVAEALEEADRDR